MPESPESTKLPSSTEGFFLRPEKIRAFVVGLIRWQYPELFPGFPGRSRADMRLARLLSKRGIPDTQLRYIRDEAATIETLRSEFKALLNQTQPGETLILYYSGHGAISMHGRPFFSSYDTDSRKIESAWFMDEVIQCLDANFKGDRVLFLGDCCHSGAMGKLLEESPRSFEYASLCSTTAEDDSSGNWTFTESILLALNGDSLVPANEHKEITLHELAAFAKADMALFEEQRAVFTHSPDFPHAAPLSLVHKKRNTMKGLQTRLEVLWGEDWFKARIIAVREDSVKVHYIGFPATADEWINLNRTRPVQSALFHVGASIEAEWNGDWWEAEILDTSGYLHFVRFMNKSSAWDEWIGGKRIRLSRKVRFP